jgi:hypothetical protein
VLYGQTPRDGPALFYARSALHTKGIEVVERQTRIHFVDVTAEHIEFIQLSECVTGFVSPRRRRGVVSNLSLLAKETVEGAVPLAQIIRFSQTGSGSRVSERNPWCGSAAEAFQLILFQRVCQRHTRMPVG